MSQETKGPSRLSIKDPLVQRMREHAELAAKVAYCPYSNFPVGAAVLTNKGDIFAGCNVENASYGLTICAERNAVFQAAANGQQEIRAVVIVTPSPSPTPPCGACRQVIREFGDQIQIFCFTSNGDISEYEIGELLPNAFVL